MTARALLFKKQDDQHAVTWMMCTSALGCDGDAELQITVKLEQIEIRGIDVGAGGNWESFFSRLSVMAGKRIPCSPLFEHCHWGTLAN
jgi:hypothetical protein